MNQVLTSYTSGFPFVRYRTSLRIPFSLWIPLQSQIMVSCSPRWILHNINNKLGKSATGEGHLCYGLLGEAQTTVRKLYPWCYWELCKKCMDDLTPPASFQSWNIHLGLEMQHLQQVSQENIWLTTKAALQSLTNWDVYRNTYTRWQISISLHKGYYRKNVKNSDTTMMLMWD